MRYLTHLATLLTMLAYDSSQGSIPEAFLTDAIRFWEPDTVILSNLARLTLNTLNKSF